MQQIRGGVVKDKPRRRDAIPHRSSSMMPHEDTHKHEAGAQPVHLTRAAWPSGRQKPRVAGDLLGALRGPSPI